MKKHFLLLVLVLAVLVQGCIVKSLHPFYAKSDLVYKSEILNTWVDQDGNRWTIKSVKEQPQAYEMIFTKDGKEASFLAHLFQLNGNLFLDFRPLASDGNVNDLFEMHLLPSHSVAKVVQISKDVVEIKWFDEDWLHSLFSQNRIKISHEVIIEENSGNDEDKSYVLTASTSELRKFLMKYGNEEAAFTGDDAMHLVLKRAI
ncbi:MAG TPA: hypothetical protein VGD65_08730 [Chryseosolibacter sp.]